MISEIGLMINKIGLVLCVYISLFSWDIFFDPVRKIVCFLRAETAKNFRDSLHNQLRYLTPSQHFIDFYLFKFEILGSFGFPAAKIAQL